MGENKNKFTKEKFMVLIKTYFWIIIGSFLAAAAINIFLVPYKIAPGGVSGIATVLFYLTGGGLKVGTTMLVLNVPLFILGMRFIGKGFTVRTLISTFLLSIFIDTMEPYSKSLVETYLAKPDFYSSPDLLLYSIFGGFIMGLGLGLVFRSGATTGGTDLAARVVHHFMPAITIGQLLMFIDTGVIIFAAIAFRSFILALYAIVTLYISSIIIDAILEGVNFAKAVLIISDKSEEIAEKVMNDIGRGVTGLKGKGMYTREDKNVLLCILHRSQIPKLKEIVRAIDESAFIILTDAREVMGEGFKTT